MEKEIKKLVYLFVGFILCVIYLTAYWTGKYYENKYNIERKSIELAYYQATFSRDLYANMYYKEIGNEEMAKLYERPNIFEREENEKKNSNK